MSGIKRALVFSMMAALMLAFSGSLAMAEDKDFAIEEIKEYKRVVTPPKNEDPNMVHWLFVECDHWAGCYMPCRGKLDKCMRVAHEADWTVISVHSRKASNLTEANSLQGPVPLPSKPE